MSIDATQLILLSQLQNFNKQNSKSGGAVGEVDSTQALLFAVLLSSALLGQSSQSGSVGLSGLDVALESLAPRTPEQTGNFSTYNQLALGLTDPLTPPVVNNIKKATQAYATSAKSLGSSEIEKLITDACNKYRVNQDLVREVIRAESGFNPKATSPVGAQGLMQLMPSTAKGLGVTNAYDPVQNIDGGVRMLKNLLKTYDGNIQLALAAYNAGQGAVAKYNGIPPYKETQNYVAKITSRLNALNTVI